METRNKKDNEARGGAIPVFPKETVRTFMLYDYLCGLKPTASLDKLKKVLGEQAPTLVTVS